MVMRLIASIVTLLVIGLCGCRRPIDVCANADGALSSLSFVFLSTPHSGERVSSGFTVRGCSRTFESNVPWKLLDAAGTQLAAGSTTGGGVDGPGPFSFTVTYAVPTRQVGHLDVSDEDVSGGEATIKPVRNVIPLVLNP
jgi:hypothetical protein